MSSDDGFGIFKIWASESWSRLHWQHSPLSHESSFARKFSCKLWVVSLVVSMRTKSAKILFLAGSVNRLFCFFISRELGICDHYTLSPCIEVQILLYGGNGFFLWCLHRLGNDTYFVLQVQLLNCRTGRCNSLNFYLCIMKSLSSVDDIWTCPITVWRACIFRYLWFE